MPEGQWIQKATGGVFHLEDPQADEVCIEDIASSLSKLCRFTGHTKEFYSVAQHCVLVSRFCNKEDALWGLLHDASEAYTGDLSRPLRLLWKGVAITENVYLRGFKEVESAIQCAVCQRFCLAPDMPAGVKAADNMMLLLERRDLLPYVEWPTDNIKLWELDKVGKLPAAKLTTWTHEQSKDYFLARYVEIVNG